MAFANGTYPASALAVVKTARGQMLRAEAAEAWDALASAIQERYGWLPALTDSYRPYSVQERIFLDRYRTTYQEFAPGRVDRRSWRGKTWWRRRGTASASTPGLSNHGLGLAVDVTALGGFNGQRYRELASLATSHGWDNVTGRKIDEAWHWEFNGRVTAPIPGTATPAPTTPDVQEDDMTPDQARQLSELHDLLSPGKAGVRFNGAVYQRIDDAAVLARQAVDHVAAVPGAVWGFKPTGNSTAGELLAHIKMRLSNGTKSDRPIPEVAEALAALKGLPERIWAHKPTGVSTAGALLAGIKQRVIDGHAGTKPLPEVAELTALVKKLSADLEALRAEIKEQP